MCHSQHTALLTDTACRHISQFAEQGGKKIMLYGGEPTMHPQLPVVVRHATNCLGQIQVVTNGAYLEKPRVAEALWDAAEKANVVARVSLNSGKPETHAKLHGVPDFFWRVVKGMQGLQGSRVRLGVSFLVEEANADEILLAYAIAQEVGATDFYLRPKTGLHGIGLESLSPEARAAVQASVDHLTRPPLAPAPALHVPGWYVRFLETNRPPDTAKSYPACYFCAAARLAITPPDPGWAWSCTYWRADPRFHVADLSEVPFGSPEFERHRQAAIRRVNPSVDCAGVICNRHEANQAIWKRHRARETATSWGRGSLPAKPLINCVQ
jgi:hypothetical protein